MPRRVNAVTLAYLIAAAVTAAMAACDSTPEPEGTYVTRKALRERCWRYNISDARWSAATTREARDFIIYEVSALCNAPRHHLLDKYGVANER